MTIIYVCENICERLAVTTRNKGWVPVQRLEDVSNDDNIIYEVNPMEIFLGKSQVCNMTEFSGARDKKVFDGNTILLKVNEENNKHSYVYIGGDKVCNFLTDDKIYKHISNMGNNLTPYSIAIGWENVYYLTPFFRFVQRKNIDIDDINKLFDIDYYNIMKLEKIKINEIHSNI